MLSELTVAGRRIGHGQPCFIIAEAGVNHNGDLHRALDLIDVAATAGADAVKFQTFEAERLATRDAPKAGYQIETTESDESHYAMLKRLELSYEDHAALVARCAEHGVLFLSTPFDERACDMLADLGVAAFKTPSGELTNIPYLQHVARKGKPMIVSTGMATLGEVEEAMLAVCGAGAEEVALLHCVSNYPADPASVNLNAMKTLRRAFCVPVGYSDHAAGIEVALASVALGACVIEKHYTLDRNLPGPDHRASLEPDELAVLIKGIRIVESSLGDGRKMPAQSEIATAAVARKSLVLTRDVSAGEVLTDNHIDVKRPGTGIAPKFRAHVTGRAIRVASRAGTVLAWEMLS